MLTRGPVVTQPVGFDDQIKLGPVEVHAKSVHALLCQGARKASAVDQPNEASLQLRVREREGAPIQDRPHCSDAIDSTVILD